MKKLSHLKSLLCLIVLSSLLCTNVFAGGTYEFPDYGFSIEIPNSYIVLTQDTTHETACRNFFGMSAEDFCVFLKKNGCLFQAVIPSGDRILSLNIGEDDASKKLFNLSDVSDQAIEENVIQHPSELEAGLNDGLGSDLLLLNSSLYHNDLTWVHLEMMLVEEGSYCYQYLTVCNGFRITLTQKSFGGPLPEALKYGFQNVCDTIKFDTILDNPSPVSQSSTLNFSESTSPFTVAAVTGLLLAIIALCVWEKKRSANPTLEPPSPLSPCALPENSPEFPTDTASCEPSPSLAHSAPVSSPAVSSKNRFYAEHCDLICTSVTNYLNDGAALKTDAETHTSASVIPILFPLYLFSAVTIFIDHTLETYGFEWLNKFFASAHKESLYPQAVEHYNEFAKIYNSCPHNTKEAFESWQYKASKKAAQEIYGSSDTATTGLVFASLCHFTQDYVELLKKQDFLPRSSSSAPVPAPPPPSPDSLRDPSTLIQTPDNYVPLFCRKCGAVIPIDSVYCPECGEKVVVIR